jgi:hypothetical protein
MAETNYSAVDFSQLSATDDGKTLLYKDQQLCQSTSSLGEIVNSKINSKGYITSAVEELAHFYDKDTIDGKFADFGGFEIASPTGEDDHPDVENPDVKKIYLVKKGTKKDKYCEWIWTKEEGSSENTWVLIGETTVELTDYVTTSALNDTLTGYQPVSSMESYYTKSETSAASAISAALTAKQDNLTFAGENNTITSINTSAIGNTNSKGLDIEANSYNMRVLKINDEEVQKIEIIDTNNVSTDITLPYRVPSTSRSGNILKITFKHDISTYNEISISIIPSNLYTLDIKNASVGDELSSYMKVTEKTSNSISISFTTSSYGWGINELIMDPPNKIKIDVNSYCNTQTVENKSSCLIIGAKNILEGGKDSVIFGDTNYVTGTSYTIINGMENHITGGSNNHICGSYNSAYGSNNNLLLGSLIYANTGKCNFIAQKSQANYTLTVSGDNNIISNTAESNSTIKGNQNLVQVGYWINLSGNHNLIKSVNSVAITGNYNFMMGYANNFNNTNFSNNKSNFLTVFGTNNYVSNDSACYLLGNNNNIDNSLYSMVIGEKNNSGYSNRSAMYLDYSMIIGSSNNAQNQQNVIIYGSNNTSTGDSTGTNRTNHSYIFGDSNGSRNSYYSYLFGISNGASKSQFTYAFGKSLSVVKPSDANYFLYSFGASSQYNDNNSGVFLFGTENKITACSSTYVGGYYNLVNKAKYSFVYGFNNSSYYDTPSDSVSSVVVFGRCNAATNSYETIIGKYNNTAETYETSIGSKPLFVIGNGTNNARSDAFIVTENGHASATKLATSGLQDVEAKITNLETEIGDIETILQSI